MAAQQMNQLLQQALSTDALLRQSAIDQAIDVLQEPDFTRFYNRVSQEYRRLGSPERELLQEMFYTGQQMRQETSSGGLALTDPRTSSTGSGQQGRDALFDGAGDLIGGNVSDLAKAAAKNRTTQRKKARDRLRKEKQETERLLNQGLKSDNLPGDSTRPGGTGSSDNKQETGKPAGAFEGSFSASTSSGGLMLPLAVGAALLVGLSWMSNRR